jgi:hypothetical protein
VRVQDKVLLMTAAAWNAECPSAVPQLCKSNPGMGIGGGPIAVSPACAVPRKLVLDTPLGWIEPGHATESKRVECHS